MGIITPTLWNGPLYSGCGGINEGSTPVVEGPIGRQDKNRRGDFEWETRKNEGEKRKRKQAFAAAHAVVSFHFLKSVHNLFKMRTNGLSSIFRPKSRV